MEHHQDVDWCCFANNAPDYLCITGPRYANVTLNDREEPSTENVLKLSKMYDLPQDAIRALQEEYPCMPTSEAIERFGPGPGAIPYSTVKRFLDEEFHVHLTPIWSLRGVDLYSNDEFQTLRFLVLEAKEEARRSEKSKISRDRQIRRRTEGAFQTVGSSLNLAPKIV